MIAAKVRDPMAEQPQSYANHTRYLPPFHFFVLPVLMLNVLNALRLLVMSPSLSTVFGFAVALAIGLGIGLAREMANTVQDRVIRLEMRLRLAQCLPADLQPRILDLTPKQLAALRFAGDAELAELVRGILSGTLRTPKEIKIQVKNWQSDFLRA
jgi:hypothetical protein